MSAAVLRASGLSLRRGGRSVLDEISFDLHAGQWVALVGPNGAGKSSLLLLLAGLHRPDAGRIDLNGRTLQGWSARERARRIAWLGQGDEIEGDLAAIDIVRLARLPHHGLIGRADAADEAAVQAALVDTEATALAPRRLNALSGGERQRVLLARALAVQAPVLLLDEPATHLDVPHQRDLLALLQAQARRGVAVLSVLHDLTAALAADRVLVLAAGRCVADGAPADPALRAALVAAFDGAFSIEPVRVQVRGQTQTQTQTRWVAVPALKAAPPR